MTRARSFDFDAVPSRRRFLGRPLIDVEAISASRRLRWRGRRTPDHPVAAPVLITDATDAAMLFPMVSNIDKFVYVRPYGGGTGMSSICVRDAALSRRCDLLPEGCGIVYAVSAGDVRHRGGEDRHRGRCDVEIDIGVVNGGCDEISPEDVMQAKATVYAGEGWCL